MFIVEKKQIDDLWSNIDILSIYYLLRFFRFKCICFLLTEELPKCYEGSAIRVKIRGHGRSAPLCPQAARNLQNRSFSLWRYIFADFRQKIARRLHRRLSIMRRNKIWIHLKGFLSSILHQVIISENGE